MPGGHMCIMSVPLKCTALKCYWSAGMHHAGTADLTTATALLKADLLHSSMMCLRHALDAVSESLLKMCVANKMAQQLCCWSKQQLSAVATITHCSNCLAGDRAKTCLVTATATPGDNRVRNTHSAVLHITFLSWQYNINTRSTSLFWCTINTRNGHPSHVQGHHASLSSVLLINEALHISHCTNSQAGVSRQLVHAARGTV